MYIYLHTCLMLFSIIQITSVHLIIRGGFTRVTSSEKVYYATMISYHLVFKDAIAT
jgi:hypothetical protein